MHKVKEELLDEFGKKEILEDQETNDIVNLMSGKISKEEFLILMNSHGQKCSDADIEREHICECDEGLYNAIRHMQTKYGNPTISFDGDFYNRATKKNEPERARFIPQGNAINILQLDSIKLLFQVFGSELHKADFSAGVKALADKDWRIMLLGDWLAELAHAKQLHRRGEQRMVDEIATDYRRCADQEKHYEMQGSIEYQAHKHYEPQLIKEFVETYAQYATDDGASYYRLAKFYGGAFGKYSDIHKALFYLEKSAQSGYGLANYMMGKYFTECRGKIYIETFVERSMDHYQQAYKEGVVEGGYAIAQFADDSALLSLYGPLIIELGEDMLARHLSQVRNLGYFPESSLGMLYGYLAKAYESQGDLRKSAAYKKQGDEIMRILPKANPVFSRM